MDDWDKKQFEIGQQVFEEHYKNDTVNSIEELSSVIASLMVEHGPDGHCDGNQIIATVVWKLLKEKS